ncbi:GMC oxidoreductase [Bradyrhizobium sp. CB2312]|nr:GMC oxidoreductase [Bradyrhizobium sp. CB2312]WFU74104.1 GMC oxidoreductase [Bradyrhizobium sp. CB2312]
MPLINPNFIGEEEDLRAVVESVHAIRRVMAQESLAPVIEEEMEPGPRIRSDAEIGEWAKRAVTTMWHPVGTCRMGQDARAVVDARLRVRGVDGLRVIDASIMPNISSGNTNAPTQALARHAKAMLVEDKQTEELWCKPAWPDDRRPNRPCRVNVKGPASLSSICFILAAASGGLQRSNYHPGGHRALDGNEGWFIARGLNVSSAGLGNLRLAHDGLNRSKLPKTATGRSSYRSARALERKLF